MSVAGDGTMTLVVTVSAVQRLADPGEAIAEAKRWSEHVAVVGDDIGSVDDTRAVVDDLDVEPDIVAGAVGGGLADLRQRLRTDRHVFVGTTDQQRAIATALGWEYLTVDDAAEAAGWPLAGATGP